ncbi:uncharacterized protein LOC111332006 [Stylophora pistillata]|uniref:uncharacterized protein LOC111332006 n=1 Tax=Stylophora pistillata TaxID=50429 RepID=UPI000C03B9B5|nr:uncharacterized protein LOC111332006 [Stylophora pistillata]
MANADDGPMGKNKRENLRKVREQLQDMDSRQVLQRMSTISNKKNIPLVFTGQDEERILGILDDFERSNSLVAALQKRGDRAYDIFRQALEEVHPHLKNILPGGENEVADFKEKEKEGRKKASRTEQSYETSQTTTQPASGVKDTQFSCSSSNQPETLSQASLFQLQGPRLEKTVNRYRFAEFWQVLNAI